MIEAVIFDLGGTLMSFGDPGMDFRELQTLGLQAVYGRLEELAGQAPPEEGSFLAAMNAELDRAWERSLTALRGERLDQIMADALGRWGLGLGDGKMDRLLRAYHAPLEPYVQLYEDARPVLDSLRARGLRLGLISNTIWPGDMHDRDLARCGILGHFSDRRYSSDYGYVKPHPAIFEASLRALEVPAERAVFVGDRIIDDIGGAQGVGMRGILRQPPNREEMHEEFQAYARIRSLEPLEEIIARM